MRLKQNPSLDIRHHLIQILQFGLTTRRIRIIVTFLPVFVLHLIEQGQVEQAVTLYALLTRHDLAGRSAWFEDVAGKHVTVAATTLEPKAVSMAQERGRKLDLWVTMESILNALQAKGETVAL